jgi:hypothetical protein
MVELEKSSTLVSRDHSFETYLVVVRHDSPLKLRRVNPCYKVFHASVLSHLAMENAG